MDEYTKYTVTEKNKCRDCFPFQYDKDYQVEGDEWVKDCYSGCRCECHRDDGYVSTEIELETAIINILKENKLRPHLHFNDNDGYY